MCKPCVEHVCKLCVATLQSLSLPSERKIFMKQIQVPKVVEKRAWYFGEGTVAWYLRRRRRKRNAGSVVKSVPGLQLWLDAGVGALKSWDAAPASGMGTFFYGFPSGYTAN